MIIKILMYALCMNTFAPAVENNQQIASTSSEIVVRNSISIKEQIENLNTEYRQQLLMLLMRKNATITKIHKMINSGLLKSKADYDQITSLIRPILFEPIFDECKRFFINNKFENDVWISDIQQLHDQCNTLDATDKSVISDQISKLKNERKAIFVSIENILMNIFFQFIRLFTRHGWQFDLEAFFRLLLLGNSEQNIEIYIPYLKLLNTMAELYILTMPSAHHCNIWKSSNRVFDKFNVQSIAFPMYFISGLLINDNLEYYQLIYNMLLASSRIYCPNIHQIPE